METKLPLNAGSTIITCAVLCCAVLCAFSQRSDAALIVYTDATAFQNAATGVGLTLTSETLAADPGDPFSLGTGGDTITMDLTLGLYNGFLDSFINGGDDVTFNSTAVAGNVAGIGFHYFNSIASLSLNGGAATAGGTGPVTSGFLGLLSTDGTAITSVDSIVLTDNALPLNNPTLDGPGGGFVTATGIAAPIPEPKAVVPLLGLLGLGLFWIRRKRAHVARAS
mgnify:CR=1 FL=1